MKKIIILILGLWGLAASGQTVGQFRYDTTKFLKVGGRNHVKIENLIQTSDSVHKPLVVGADGVIKRSTYWPGSGGGGGGGGTVTSIATNNGTGVTGGTITGVGTIAIDTAIIARKAYVDAKDALKVNISDTSTMLAPYLRSAIAAATYATISNLALKVNISDTAAMLQKYKDSIAAHNIRIIGKENSLGNPSINGHVLSSTTAGVRSWVAQSGGGGGSTLPDSTWVDVKNYFTGGVTLATSTKQQRCDAWQAAIASAQSGKYGIQFSGSWDLPTDSLIITEKLTISGVGTGSELTTTDNSGSLLYVNQNTLRAWYNVIFPGRKSFTAQNFLLQYRGALNPTSTSAGIKISVDSSVTFDHKLIGLTIDSFYIGAKFHNVGSSMVNHCYFRNNRAYGILNTTSESNDLGKIIIDDNVFTTVGPLGGEPDSTAHIKIEGGAGMLIINNDMYGYTDYGIWMNQKTIGEFFQSYTGSEYMFQFNRISFVLDYAILIDSYYGKSGTGAGINTGNRIYGVQIQGNYAISNGLLKTVGGVGSIQNVQITGNESAYPNNVQIPSGTKIPIVINGAAMTDLQLNDNIFNATLFGGVVPAGVTKPISVTGTISGGLMVADNLYIGYPSASDLPDTEKGWALNGNSGTTGQFVLGTTGNRSLRLITNNTQKAILDSTGNLGIGTTAPSYKLDIANSLGSFNGLKVESSSSNGVAGIALGNNNGKFGLIGSYGSVPGGAVLAGWQDKFAIAGYGDVLIGSNILASAGGLNNIKFLTGGTASTQERMTIFSNGNVGIGSTHTDSLSGKLIVNGAFYSTSITGPSGKVSVGSTSVLDVTNNRIGIGVSSPADVLDIRKDQPTVSIPTVTSVILTNANAAGIAAYVFTSDGTTRQGGLQYNNTTASRNLFATSYTDIPFYFGVNNAISMTLGAGANATNVGIGTTAPTDKLQVVGNLSLSTAGNKIKIATGANASVGTSTLVAGTVTVSTTAALTASKIFVTVVTPGGTQGFISVPTITNATSFVINSSSATETSTVNWWVIN